MKRADKKMAETASKLEKIDAEITKIINDNNVVLNRYKMKIEEAQESIDKANKAITEATEQADASAYHRAKDALREAQDSMEMHQTKLDQKTKEPIINKQKAVGYKDLIKGLLLEQEKATAQKIYTLFQEVEKLNDDFQILNEIANRMLSKVDFDIMHSERSMADRVFNSLAGSYRISGLEGLKRFFE